jgi:hypothetical protein
MRPKAGWIVAALAVGTVTAMDACSSSVRPPNDQWDAAQADVGRAQASGAPGVPAARLHLKLAEEDLAMSKQLDNGDGRRTTLIELARAEAQLALSCAKAAQASDDARKAADDLAKTEASPVK